MKSIIVDATGVKEVEVSATEWEAARAARRLRRQAEKAAKAKSTKIAVAKLAELGITPQMLRDALRDRGGSNA